MNILLICPMMDNRSGTYLHDTFIEMGHRVAYFDWKHIIESKGIAYMNKELVNCVDQLKPDFSIIVKGLGITDKTIKEIKKVHNHPIVGWIFDVTISGIMVKDVEPYIKMIKEMDLFYTIDNDAVPELKELGVNAKWLPQASCLPFHGEQIFNNVQKRKYGADIVFAGSVGSIHPNRTKFLKRIAEEGFDFKLYGDVLYKEKQDPDWVKDHHTGYDVNNEMHSLVCNTSKIVIGLDGWPDRSKAYSLRLYKTLCAGGFYLGIDTKDIGEVFKKGEHLDTFKDPDEMIKKILKYLSDNDLREKIAKAGQKEVLDKHMLNQRLKIIIDDVEKLK